MSVSWPQLLPAVVLAVVALVLPGLVPLRALGVPRLAALLGAPAVSVLVLVLSGVCVRSLGLSWTAGIGLAATLVATGLAAAVARVIRRRWVPAAAGPGPALDGGEVGAAVLVGIVGLAAAYLVLAGAAPSPLASPQMPDVVVHLGAVEWMVRHGSASLLDVVAYAQLDGALSYPGGFHAVAAAVCAWSGVPVTATWHALLVVVVGLVWPFGVMLVARVVFGRGAGVLVTAGLLTLVLSSFPVRFLAWGPLWSNLLANALLPAVLAAALCALAPIALIADRPFGPGRARALAYAAAGVLAIGVTQPNALASAAVLAVPAVGSALPHWRGSLARPWVDRVVRLPVVLLAVVVAILVIARIAPPKMYFVNAHVIATWHQALTESVTLFDGTAPENLLILALVLVGLGVLARDARRRWIVGGLLALLVIDLVLYAVNGPIVRQFTWLWWNDHVRVRAALVLPGLLAATAGALAAARLLDPVLARLRPGRPRARQAGAALVAALLVLAVRGGIPVHRGLVEGTYLEDGPEFSWVTPSEQAALRQLSGLVPPGSVVAANPYSGGMFFYVVAGVEVFFPTENSLQLPDRRLVGTSLHLVESLPAVCAAVRAHRVDFVLTGGDMHIWGVLDHTPEYAGVEATALNPRFEVVGTAGPYTLRRVPACRQAPAGSPLPGPGLSMPSWPATSAS